jgi:hypothetical protein
MRVLSLLAAVSVAMPAMAANLVTNGNFESVVGRTTSFQAGVRFAGNAALPGWDVDGLTALYFPGQADTVGADTEYGTGDLKLYGPNNGYANGLPATSPAGGNYIAGDADFTSGSLQAKLSQTITGLTPGKVYAVSFWWAAAQQLNFAGATTESWKVSLGNQQQQTAILNNPQAGFQAWRQTTFNFTAQNSSEVLQFLAHGTPGGQPPFSLLDGVSMTAVVPEPASWAMLIMGFGLVGAVARRRQTLVA